MKKSNFVAMILGTISCLFFALGMCMAMIEEWNTFRPGVIVGCVGIVFALITVLVWRKMENKAPIKITGKAAFTMVVGISRRAGTWSRNVLLYGMESDDYGNYNRFGCHNRIISI